MSHPVLPGIATRPASQPPQRPLAGIDEIAEYLGVPKQTIYTWSSRGRGPRLIKVGRHLKARWSDIEAYLDAQSTGGCTC